MSLDKMQSFINQALTTEALTTLNKYREIEASSQPQQVKDAHRALAIKALESVVTYLRGDYGILDMTSIKRAKDLEEKEPQFIAVAEHNQKLTQELHLLKTKMAKSEPQGGKVDLDGVKRKLTSTSPKKKTKKKATKTSGFQCGKCGRKFKSRAGLGKHLLSCKG